MHSDYISRFVPNIILMEKRAVGMGILISQTARFPSTNCQLRLSRSGKPSRISLCRHWIFRRAYASWEWTVLLYRAERGEKNGCERGYIYFSDRQV